MAAISSTRSSSQRLVKVLDPRGRNVATLIGMEDRDIGAVGNIPSELDHALLQSGHLGRDRALDSRSCLLVNASEAIG